MAMRSENDYVPNNMASKRSESRQTRQLDFYQAMADFQHMFPNMDEEIIEAVLRANNGAVDATIDQLLTMNIDNEEDEEDEALQATASHIEATSVKRRSSPSSSSSVQSKGGISMDDPPPYSEAIRAQPPPLISGKTPPSGKPRLSSKGRQNTAPPNLLDLDIGTFASTLATVVTDSTSPKSLLEDSPSPEQTPPNRRATPRKWNPPLLGNLPDDFLRLSPSCPSSSRTHHRPSRPLGRSQSMPAQQKPQGVSPHEISSSMLQRKLRENERRRRSTPSEHDPGMVQYLEDERMAIMLQNSEFLEELRQNEDFMKTLERDRMNSSAFEPGLVSSSSSRTREQRRSHTRTRSSEETRNRSSEENRNRSSEENPVTESRPVEDATQPVKAMAPLPPVPDDQIENFTEGYGRDNQDTLEAFPFTQKLENGATEADSELRRQLKHMGKASKKQFADLARRFFSRRKKKSSRQLLKESLAPSTANLLEEEEEEEDMRKYKERPEFEPLPGAQLSGVPGYKTVQRPPYNPDTTVRYFDGKPTDMV